MEFHWYGDGAGTKSDFKDGRNWKNAAGTQYAQAIYPSSDAARLDDAMFDIAAVTAVAGVTLTNKLSSLVVTAAYMTAAGVALDLASSGTYLVCLAERVSIESTGNVYLEGASSTGLEQVLVNGAATGKKVYLKGYLNNLSALDDACEIGASSTVAGTLVFGDSSTGSPVVTILTSVTLPSVVSIRGGTVTCSSAVTTLDATDGTWTQAAGNITTLNAGGATVYCNAGNVGTINAYGAGTVSFASGSSTRYVTDVIAGTGSVVNLDNKIGNVHVRGTVEYRGGTVILPNTRELEEAKTEVYAGASDAKLGIAPQSVAAAASVWGEDIYIGQNDRLEVLAHVGATDATSAVFELHRSSDTTHADEAAITTPAAAASVSFGATDDNKTKKLVLWGSDITDGKTSIRLKCAVTGGTAALVAASYQMYRD